MFLAPPKSPDLVDTKNKGWRFETHFTSSRPKHCLADHLIRHLGVDVDDIEGGVPLERSMLGHASYLIAAFSALEYEEIKIGKKEYGHA